MPPLFYPDLFTIINEKGQLISTVYQNTLDSIRLIKKTVDEIVGDYLLANPAAKGSVPMTREHTGDHEVKLQFAEDILVFTMLTNIFEFSRYHEVMSTSYIKDDKSRSYCGIINIYNFLSDSYKYNRVNDVGYLIGRIFINKDTCYFIEGKREVGLLYNSFGQEKFDGQAARKVVESAIMYAINFDLLTPPFDSVKEISLAEMQSLTDSHMLKTGKRLGFKFQADSE
jgi:hypothetical protein